LTSKSSEKFSLDFIASKVHTARQSLTSACFYRYSSGRKFIQPQQCFEVMQLLYKHNDIALRLYFSLVLYLYCSLCKLELT